MGTFNGSFNNLSVNGTLKIPGGILQPPVPWIPTINFGGSSVGVVYSIQSASYIKLGQLVNYSYTVSISSKGSSVGALTVAGFPFPAYAGQEWVGSVFYNQSLSVASGYENITSVMTSDISPPVGPGAQQQFVALDAQGVNPSFILTNSNVSNGLSLIASGAYWSSS